MMTTMGVVDELDCAPFDPAVSECADAVEQPTNPPSSGGGSIPNGPVYGIGGGGGSGGFGERGTFLVTTLPVTGTGDGTDTSDPHVWVALVMAGALMLGWMVLQFVASRRVLPVTRARRTHPGR